MNIVMPTFELGFYVAALPVLILCVGAIISMLQSAFTSVGSEKATTAVLLVSLVAATASTLFGKDGTEYIFGSVLTGTLSQFGQLSIMVIGTAIALMFRESFLASKFFRGEIASLYQLSLAGMLVMVASDDLITMFVGLELSSIALYALVGYIDPSRRSQEGAVKYFILGAFAAGLLLYGFGMLYAGTGSMRISEIVAALPELADQNWVRIGALFTAIGLCFKLSLAPFHLWAPDAYEAAPTGITALMATSVKIMVLIVMSRVFASGFTHLYEVWTPALMFVATMSMIFGNIMALVQSNLKRMLAYSSIAHSGYMAVALCAMGGEAGFSTASVMFYIVGYSLTSLGAFGILMWLESEKNDCLMLDDLNGLYKSHPWAAFAMATFMFAFAGMPPTVGFIGKFFVFNAALKAELYSLVIIGVIGSTISLYYYLRVIVRMYMTEKDESIILGAHAGRFTGAMVAVVLIATIVLGTILPGPAMKLVKSTVGEVSAAH